MKLRTKLAAAAGALMVAGIGALVWVVQSDWLREQVRLAVISEAEKVVGGKTELGAFRWDWSARTLEADHLVIHGTEPAAAAPLLTVERVRAQLRVISFLSRAVSIESIAAENPRVHIIVAADGATNVPKPKTPTSKPGLQPLIDLKVGQFDVRNGMFAVEAGGRPPRQMPWSASGRNLTAHLDYDGAGKKYTGTLALDPLRILSASMRVTAAAALEQDRITVSSAQIVSGDMELNISHGEMLHFGSPVFSARYQGHVSCKSGLLTCPSGAAGSVSLDGNARYVSEEDYQASGNFTGAGDFAKLKNAHVNGAFEAKPGSVLLNAVRGTVLGGSFSGDATLRNFETYYAKGMFGHFDLRQAAALETKQALPYDGMISGTFDAAGNLNRAPDINAKLEIAPGGSGPAAKGEIAVHYAPARSLVELGNSWIELPHTRADVSGTLGATLRVKAESKDLTDLKPVLSLLSVALPESLSFTDASFDGTVTGPLANPKFAGHSTAQNLSVNNQTFESLAGDLSVSADSASVRNCLASFGDVRAQGSGSVALAYWRVVPSSSIMASVEVRNADMTRVLAMAGHRELSLTGLISGSGRITGTWADPLAAADVTLSRGAIYSQPFDSITGRLQLTDRKHPVPHRALRLRPQAGQHHRALHPRGHAVSRRHP